MKIQSRALLGRRIILLIFLLATALMGCTNQRTGTPTPVPITPTPPGRVLQYWITPMGSSDSTDYLQISWKTNPEATECQLGGKVSIGETQIIEIPNLRGGPTGTRTLDISTILPEAPVDKAVLDLFIQCRYRDGGLVGQTLQLSLDFKPTPPKTPPVVIHRGFFFYSYRDSPYWISSELWIGYRLRKK